MNLLDIIIFSLKIFSAISIIVVGFSYFIYKIKSGAKVKPYMVPTVVKEPEIKIEPAENFVEDRKPSYNRYVVMNEVSENSFRANPNYNVPLSRFAGRNENNGGEQFNIFNRYSNSSFEPMHKIKL